MACDGLAPKLEIRSTKSETNSKHEMEKNKTKRCRTSIFEFWYSNLFRFSDFEFRILRQGCLRALWTATAAWSLCAALAFAVPARPLYFPEASPKPATWPNLGGTTWVGMLFVPGSKVTFNADGTLVYGESGSVSRGTWKLQGNHLYFEINQYSEFATVINGNIIEGKGQNKAGQQCTPKLYREGTGVPPMMPADVNGKLRGMKLRP